MSELEQAEAMREEARQLLKQSNESLEQSKRFSDLALTNQRRMVFALSSLLPQPLSVNFEISQDDDIRHAEQVAIVAEELRDQMKNIEVFDIVHAINVLAMANTDVIHVMVDFCGHVNTFDVRAFAVTTNYQGGAATALMKKYVDLGDEDALRQLLSIESQLTELIIEAREEAEAKAKEYHPKHCIHGAILYGKCKKCAEASEGGEA
ncbi:hypothetical protein [Vibrio alginolyticus]|uniref:hypothetical protein n=1 Tax=Vibrio alginolyticus TaxID=663 RepID=UPI001F550930|nr:hypothetical protein [Vibrio alginolyticus]